MARTANLSVSVTWGGAAAARGLQSFTQSLTTLSGVANTARKSMASMMPSNLFSATGIKGLADMKAGMQMIRGVFQTFVMAPVRLAANILQMGAEMESAGIRMGALMDNMNAGKKTVRALSDAAMATGVPFEEMAKGFKSLMSEGLSAQGAVDVINQTRNAALLMGSGAEGFNAVIGAVNQLQANAAATEAPLKALQAGGIPVMEELAKKLSTVTGEVVDVNKAMEMVRQGTVLTATAIDAVFAASSSEKVAAAAMELEQSVEHQLAMAQAGFQEVLRNIGAELIKTFDPAQALAGFRGVMDGILQTVRMIADTFLPVIDPKDKGKGLQETFKFARDMTFTVAEQLIKGAITFKDYISDAASLLKVVLSEMKVMMLEQTKFWTTGWSPFGSGRTLLSTMVISAEEHAALPEQIAAAKAEADKIKNQGFAAGTNLRPVEDAFKKLRDQAAAQDKAKVDAAAKAMADLAAAAKAAKPPLDANAKAVQAQAAAAKEAAAKVETMNKNVRDMASKMFTDFATPFEKFTEKMRMALAEVNQAAGPEKNRFQAAMRRRVGADIEAFLKEFGPKAAEPAAAQLAGSAGLIESDIRARMEADGKAQDVPGLLKQAMDNAKNQADQQVKRLDELVNAAHKANMFKTIMALPKP